MERIVNVISRKLSALLKGVALSLVVAIPALAQQSKAEPSAEELAKKTQNPVADLISVPLQSNFNLGAGFNHNKIKDVP